MSNSINLSLLPTLPPSRSSSPLLTPRRKGLRTKVNAEEFSPDKQITIYVDPEKKIFTIPKILLEPIPYFHAATSSDRFLEGQEGKINLPDIDVKVFKKFIEYINHHEYTPRLIPENRDLGDHEYSRRLETYLEVFEPYSKWPRLYDDREERLGHWTTSNETHELFEEQLALFCLAEYFMIEDLKNLCLEKINLFPLGPRAFSALADQVLSGINNSNDYNYGSIASTTLHQLTQDCFNYHEVYLNDHCTHYEYNGITSTWQDISPSDKYAEMEELLDREMTSHGRAIYSALKSAREDRDSRAKLLHSSMGWECTDEQIGVCEADYSINEALSDFKAFHNLDDSSQSPSAAIPEEILDYDNLFPGFQFLQSQTGDWYSSIIINKPIKGLIYGKNVRLNSWGFHRRRNIRMLETKSWRFCGCLSCSPPSFRTRLHGRLVLHDPQDLGLEYRPGPRQVRHQRRMGRQSSKVIDNAAVHDDDAVCEDLEGAGFEVLPAVNIDEETAGW
ncbi:MAG: hypothetical protein M1812_006019 [Candelaria pacifica]|nr:MAG: hypothetical protein M1812_006019 [Candelaria pacifica]